MQWRSTAGTKENQITMTKTKTHSCETAGLQRHALHISENYIIFRLFNSKVLFQKSIESYAWDTQGKKNVNHGFTANKNKLLTICKSSEDYFPECFLKNVLENKLHINSEKREIIVGSKHSRVSINEPDENRWTVCFLSRRSMGPEWMSVVSNWLKTSWILIYWLTHLDHKHLTLQVYLVY